MGGRNLADGSSVVRCFVGAHISGLSPNTGAHDTVAVYFFAHYFFSSLTAHTSALMPIMLGVDWRCPALRPEKLRWDSRLDGLDGVISPYAPGPRFRITTAATSSPPNSAQWHHYGIIFPRHCC